MKRRRPDAKTTTAADDSRERLARRAAVHAQLGAVSAILGVTGRKADVSALTRANRRFGDSLPRIADEAANAVDLCPRPFGGLPFATEWLRDQVQRLDELGDAEVIVEGMRQRIRDEAHACKADIAAAVALIQDITRSTLSHPSWDRAEKEELGTAAHLFLAAIRDRESAISAASLSTRARNAETGAREAAARAERAQLEIENRFLSGETLRPSDLVARSEPVPVHPGRRRAPRRKSAR